MQALSRERLEFRAKWAGFDSFGRRLKRVRAGSFVSRDSVEPEGAPMNATLLSIAIFSQLGSPLVIPVGDVVPVIDVERTCKETAATDKAMKLDLAQPVENCMRDENAAREQLATIWSTYSASVRDRCAQEATLVGTASYVDLLTCMQMTDPAKLSPTPALRGASKNRNKN
jgi:hypothetical protein